MDENKNNDVMAEEEKTRLFDDYLDQSEDMEPLRAMKLLTKACMDYVGVSKGYSTMAYYAARAWLDEFNKTEHPLVEQTTDLTFAEVMPLICPGYSEGKYGAFDVIHINRDNEEEILYKMMEMLDEETACALCRGYWLGNL